MGETQNTSASTTGAQQADGLSQAEPVTRLGPSGFDPSRERVKIAGPSRGFITRDGVVVGRLLVHDNPNGSGFAVSHAGTGGQVLVLFSEDDAIAAAQQIERDHADGLDILDLLDWGQNLTEKMRKHPAVARLRKFRENAIAMEARQGGDRATGLHPKDDSAGPQDIAQDQSND